MMLNETDKDFVFCGFHVVNCVIIQQDYGKDPFSVLSYHITRGNFLINMLLIFSSFKMHRKGILCFYSLPVNESQYERLNGCLCLQRNDLCSRLNVWVLCMSLACYTALHSL